MTMKSARAFYQKCLYVDCPYCGNTVELGEGIVLDEEDVEVCGKCQKTFICEEPGSNDAG